MSPRLRRWLLSLGVFIVLFVCALLWVADRYVEPALRQRIGVLIVQGSNGLYQYRLSKLDVSLFGGSVELDSFAMWVDSANYRRLAAESRLPALTMKIDMPHGHLRGLGLWSLLAGRQLHLQELFTSDARVELWRNAWDERRGEPPPPLWKAIRPTLSGIRLGQLRLEGIRFAYRYVTDGSSMQLKFDTCTALLRDIRIDSAAVNDPERVGFCRYINLHFYDLKFRTPDSAVKLKARVIDYSSKDRLLTIRDFKLQPTLKDKDEFYQATALQRQMAVIAFGELQLKGFRLESFVRDNAVLADSLVIDRPDVSLYTDKTLPPTLEGKTGTYPHQRLLKAGYKIGIGAMALRNLSVSYTERGEKSGQEGTLKLDRLQLSATNITNIPERIARNAECRAHAEGRVQGASPISADFRFNLSDTEGRFAMDAVIRNATAAQLNGLAQPLAYVRVQRLDLQELRFSMQGDEYTARAEVRMHYRNLFIDLQKEDPESGLLRSKKFLNKIINKYTLRHDNPEGGVEMVARNVEQSRLMTQTFFGLIWKTVFSGMQTIMTNTGEPE